MNVRITDLLDHYHDTYIKLDAPVQKGAIICMDRFEQEQKHISPVKKLLVTAACLILLLTGAAFFHFIPAIILSSEEQGAALNSPISAQEPEAVPAEEQQETEIYVAELGLAIGADGEQGSLLRFLYNRESLCYTWFMEIDSLEELLYDTSPEGNMMESLRNEEFQTNLTSWGNMFLQAYMAEAYVTFSDGNSFLVGGGAATTYEDGLFLEYGSVMPEDTYADLIPEYLVIRGEKYPLVPADEDMREAERNRIEKRQALAAQGFESNPEEPEPAGEEDTVVYPEDCSIAIRAEDSDGDGFLTVDLTLPVETESASGTICRFSLRISTGEFKWFYESQQLVDALYQLSPEGDMSIAMNNETFSAERLAFMNSALETHLSTAYLGFADGTEICIGCGDVVGFSDGLFWDGYKITAPGAEAAQALEGVQVSYLKVNGVTYQFI